LVATQAPAVTAVFEALKREANLTQNGGTAFDFGKCDRLETDLLHLVQLVWGAVYSYTIAQALLMGQFLQLRQEPSLHFVF
jgi:hypothetical protein